MIPEMGDFLHKYRRGRAKSTVEDARSDLRQFSRYLTEEDILVAERSSDDLDEYFHRMNRENYSNHTIHNRHLTVRKFIDYLGRKTQRIQPTSSKLANTLNERTSAKRWRYRSECS